MKGKAFSGVKPFNTSASIKARRLSFDFFFFFLADAWTFAVCVRLCCLFLVLLQFFCHSSLFTNPAAELFCTCPLAGVCKKIKTCNHLHKRIKGAESLKMSQRSLNGHTCFQTALTTSCFAFYFLPSLFLHVRLQTGRLDFASHQEHQALRLGQKSNVTSPTCKSFILFQHLIPA